MSYCVNCGVELEAAQKKCPLCGVEVINPRQPVSEEKDSYPIKRDEFKKKDRIFWFKFISLLLLVPIVTCVMSDLLITKRLSWSVYVVAGVLMAWTISTTPFYFKKFSITKMLCIDVFAVIICLLIIENQAPGGGWVLRIALPAALFVLLSGLVIVFLYRHLGLRGLGVSAALFIAAAIMMPGLEILVDLYSGSSISLFWSWFAALPCLAVAVLLIFLNNSKRFRSEFEKRMHF